MKLFVCALFFNSIALNYGKKIEIRYVDKNIIVIINS